MSSVLIQQLRVADPQSEFFNQLIDLYIVDGIIREAGPALKPTADSVQINGTGHWVSPGWVDVLADYREPGFEHKETIATGLAAAAAGGFTRVLLAPNTKPALDNKSTVRYVMRQAAGHAVNLHPLGAVSKELGGKELAEMLDMRAHGALAFSDGWQPVQNSNVMLKALEYVKAFNGIVLQLPVDTALASGGLMHEGPVSTRLGMAGVPPLAESLMVHRDLELLAYTGSRLHISGVSTEASLRLIRQAKDKGLDVTCSVTPYHLVLTDEALTTYDSVYKVSPPLRPEADRRALVAALADGTIDCIASHHRPQEWDAKAKEFDYAGEGMNVQELVFPILWHHTGREVGLDRLVDALALAPRRIFGLPMPGLSIGAEAELTIFTTEGQTSLSAMQSMSANNPFVGQNLQGHVSGIISNHNTTITK
jgi:dihydroorotase